MSAYLHPYNPQWPKRYKRERELIQNVVSRDLNLFHIGSTAIQNLYSKDCIDILGVIPNFHYGFSLVKSLESINYEYRGEYGISNRHYFSKKQPKKFHLHLFPKGSDPIKKHLKYVELMSNNNELVEEFNFIKQQLQMKFPKEKSDYQKQKSFFYERILSEN